MVTACKNSAMEITVDNTGKIVESAPRFTWNESVVCEQLRSSKLKPVPIYGVFGEKSRQFLGSYGRKEHILQNADFAGRIEERLNQLGFPFERKVTLMTGNFDNSQCELEYTLGNVGFGDGTEQYKVVIKALNSYDRSTNTSLQIKAKRLICLNGAYGIVATNSFSRRHSEGLHEFLAENLEKSITDSTGSLQGQIARIEQYSIQPEQRFYILRNMFKHNSLRFSGLAARRIEEFVSNPTEDETGLAPFPQLYQASMRYFRDLDNGQVADSKGNKQSKPELARRMGEYVGEVLAALPSTPKFQEQLLPEIGEDVYARKGHKVSHVIAN